MTSDEILDPEFSPSSAGELDADDAMTEAVNAVARSLAEEPDPAPLLVDEVVEATPEAGAGAEPEAEPDASAEAEPAPPAEAAQGVPAQDAELDAAQAPSDLEGEAPEAAEEAEAPEEPQVRATRVAWWPFLAYGVLWIGLAATSYVLLTGSQADLPAFRQDSYQYLVLAGLVLTVLGPLVTLAVWLFAWFKADKGERGGMLTTALVRGAVATFLGVVVWWGVLVLVDALRLGLV